MLPLDSAGLEKQPVNHLRNLAAVVIGIVPIYAYLMWSHLSRGGLYTKNDLLYYPLVVGGGWILVLLVLYRYFCGRRLGQLNRQSGIWWKDILTGLGLAAGLLALFFFLQPTVNPLFPQQAPPPAITQLISGLSRDPFFLALWLGPVVWIGVAIFEELQRVFMLDLLWDMGGPDYLRWIVIAASALLFALAHTYQGPANMTGIFIQAVVYGIFYLKVGRLWPMIVAHGLYDSLQLSMAVIQIRQAGL